MSSVVLDSKGVVSRDHPPLVRVAMFMAKKNWRAQCCVGGCSVKGWISYPNFHFMVR